MKPASILAATLCAAFVSLPFHGSHAQGLTSFHVKQGGIGLYTVYFDQHAVEAEDTAGEPAARSTRDSRNQVDFYGWQKPKTRALVKRFERELGVKAVSMTSYSLPTFSAYLAEATVTALRKDPRVERVVAVFSGHDDFSAWADISSGDGEVIPWGKQAIGANDTQDFSSSQNTLYMIDGVALVDNTVSPHSDVNLTLAPVNNHFVPMANRWVMAPGHANHVAGILGARIFTGGVRGVAPGIQVVNVIRGQTDAEVIAAIDWVIADTLQRGIFGIANISSNSARWASGGAIYPHLQRLSARVFVVQSAGNDRVDACTVAFGPATVNDGVFVVGGLDENEQQAIWFDNTPSGYTSQPGSNWGACVEAWAPSQRVRSTWNTSATATMQLSGTSMAAPHVAAMAARYGSNATSPAQREAYVRSRLVATGTFDEVGAPIRIPSITDRTSTTRLINISTRAYVGTGHAVAIAGFIVGGSSAKMVAIQGIGPSLAAHGIGNALANPTITLVRSSDNAIIASNDNWGSAPNAGQIQSAGFAPSSALESALMMSLAPGGYTVIMSGVSGGTGVGLIGVYEVDAPMIPLVNLSTRAYVGTGNDVAIGGFIVSGTTPKTFVVRATGPSLAAHGVPDTLANPTLTLVRNSDNLIVAFNDNWGTAANAWQLLPSGFAPAHANESAILITLNPGAYSAIVSGVGGTTGIGMVEVFAY